MSPDFILRLQKLTRTRRRLDTRTRRDRRESNTNAIDRKIAPF
jgi:hypothetical protein